MRTYIYLLLLIFLGLFPTTGFSQKIDAFRGCYRTESIAGFAEFGGFRYRNNILKTIEHDPRCEIIRLGLSGSKSAIEFKYNGGRDYALGLPGDDWTYYLYFGEYPKRTTLNRIAIQLQNPSQHDENFHQQNRNDIVVYFSNYFGFQPTIKHKSAVGGGEYYYYEWSNGTYRVSFLYLLNPISLPFIDIEKIL